MALTPASFRQQYPEFTDPGDYSDAAITLHLGVAVSMLDPVRWDSAIDLGVGLWVAHFLVLSRRDQLAANAGGAPGAAQGMLTSKTVDKVSASYDAASISLEDQGFWGMTTYGMRLLKFARMMGAGGAQLGNLLN